MTTDEERAIDGVLAVLSLAAANFPGGTDVTVATSGSSPANARVVLPHYTLKKVIEAGREALKRAAP